MAGCGGDEDGPTTPPPESPAATGATGPSGGGASGGNAGSDDGGINPDKIADEYAKELSGGATSGCLADPKGEGADNPGCIYSAAFAGCYEGVTGDSLGPVSYKQEFPELELQRIYEKALSDCG